MKQYQTEQRKLLADFFKEHSERAFSIDEVVAALQARISRSAVYRNVDKMVQDGALSKAVAKDGRRTLYRHMACGDCCERLHLRCEKCGLLFHMESETDEEKLKNTLHHSGFELDEHATVLLGTCKSCMPSTKGEKGEKR